MVEIEEGVGGDTKTQLAALCAELAELRAVRMQQPVTQGRFAEPIADKPEKFKGKYGSVVNGWIVGWETYFTFADPEGRHEELQRVKLAILNTDPTTQAYLLGLYDRNIWTSWTDFKDFMLKKYGLRDNDYAKWQKFMAIKQSESESVSAYGQQFMEVVDKVPRMESTKDEYVFTFRFIDWLLGPI